MFDLKTNFSNFLFLTSLCFRFMKAMTISKETVRWKLEIDGRIVEQDVEFKYLGVNIKKIW